MALSSNRFKALKKFVSEQQQLQQQTTIGQLSVFRGLPFYIWDKQEHEKAYHKTNGYCCFNHVIGLLQKNNVEHELYDYEQLIFETLFKPDGSPNHKHLFVLKATGLGISELMLRIISWICLKDNALSGSEICIITGPRIDLSIALMDRLKKLFYAKNLISFSTKETVVTLNNVRIECFPSHHLSSMRGLPNVSMIFADEADFWNDTEQNEMRDTAERYIGKSNPWICLVSTPNKPSGLFSRIQQEDENLCIYKRIYLDYTIGLNKIYSLEEIENAKRSGSFSREYCLKYTGMIGNSFTQQSIDIAVEKGKKYDPAKWLDPSYSFTSRSLGIDPAYGSSNFGLCVTQWQDDHIQVLYADEFVRPDYNVMLDKVYRLMSDYSVDSCYVDGANPSFIRSLKLLVGEDANYEEVIARHKSEGLTQEWCEKQMRIIPVNFAKEHKSMLGHAKMILEKDGGYIAINPQFDKLITALRTAVDADGTLDKEATSYNDIFDAFRLALKFYHFRDSSEYE